MRSSISRDETLAKTPEPEAAAKLKIQSLAGVARCTFRLGDLRRGVKLVTELGDSAVFKECAAILESMKQTAEAAALYEQGGQVEKAAQLFVQMKNLARAAPLMARVKASKVHAQFARAKEAAGEFAAAAEAYERAGEMDNVVRLQLEHLDGAERAFEIVRETKSSEGALSAARYCSKLVVIRTPLSSCCWPTRKTRPLLWRSSTARWSVSPQHWARRTCLRRGPHNWPSTTRRRRPSARPSSTKPLEITTRRSSCYWRAVLQAGAERGKWFSCGHGTCSRD